MFRTALVALWLIASKEPSAVESELLMRATNDADTIWQITGWQKCFDKVPECRMATGCSLPASTPEVPRNVGVLLSPRGITVVDSIDEVTYFADRNFNSNLAGVMVVPKGFGVERAHLLRTEEVGAFAELMRQARRCVQIDSNLKTLVPIQPKGSI